jgi:Ca-activated chloride channel family protein
MRFILFFLVPGVLLGQNFTKVKQMPDKTRILFVLDASGSMRQDWEGEKRMDAAKKVLTEIVDQYRFDNKLEMALRVYGHQYDSKFKNCQDTKLEVGFAATNHEQLKAKLRSLDPKGYTPIALSLEKATTDFPTTEGIRNVIILITDGLESCGGNPCALSLALQKKKIFLRPFVVGMGIEPDLLKNFDCMGRFYNTKNSREFKNVMNDIMQQTLRKTTVSVELLDKSSAPVEKNTNMTFINKTTQEALYDYVHYRDRKGITDTLEIDAILDYDLVVNTIPPVVEKNIVLKGGRHNVIKVKVPQANLRIEQKGADLYGNSHRVIVRESGQKNILNTQPLNETERYLAAEYELEILTLPPTYLKVALQADQNKVLTLEPPGLLNILNSYSGFGSIYTQDNHWVCNFSKTRMNMAIQPGKYKLVFRSEDALGSEFTVVKLFEITPTNTTRLDLTK